MLANPNLNPSPSPSPNPNPNPDPNPNPNANPRAARAIRALLSPDTSVVAVEHDLSLLDYLSDHVCLGPPSPSP